MAVLPLHDEHVSIKNHDDEPNTDIDVFNIFQDLDPQGLIEG